MFRLNNQREKLNESAEQQTNYLWEEYELTPHAAAELRNSEYEDPLALKKLIAAVKDEIRKLGTVNVNAIEEYKEVSERYTFLKGQHDDLVEAEQTLLGIIEDLDSGMRNSLWKSLRKSRKNSMHHSSTCSAADMELWNWWRMRIFSNVASASSRSRRERSCRI